MTFITHRRGVAVAKKRKALKPLVPHFRPLTRLGGMGVVTLRIPAGTDPKIARGAMIHARNKAAKINRNHEKDHWYEKGDWRAYTN